MSDTKILKADSPVTIPAPATGWLAGTGAIVGLTALIASSCCALPLALAGLGVTGAAFSGLAFLAGIRPLLLGGAAAVLLIGWAVYFWRQRSAACDVDGVCTMPANSKRTAVLLMLGSAFVGLAIVWEPYVEPILLKLTR